MKKLLLTLVVAAVAAGSAMAQNYEKNIFGVRAGLNVSNVSMDYFAPKSKAGFHVAGVYQRLLTGSLPLYLETGLQVSQKDVKSIMKILRQTNTMQLTWKSPSW